MRIIGGQFKGKSVLFLRNLITRPLKDSVKENVFNIINHSKFINSNLDGSIILDMYSGIGSFGLEALSRGAKKVTFIEKDSTALELLEKNIENLSVKEKTRVIKTDIFDSIRNEKLEKYDFFFLDPPFKDKNFYKLIEIIKKRKIFKKKSVIIIHREKKAEDDLENLLSIFLIKTYGKSKILFANF
jgi:16S rRNA (guanine966-N2)-methyltransferase